MRLLIALFPIVLAFFVPETMTVKEKIALYVQMEKSMTGVAMHIYPNERGMAMVALRDIHLGDIIAEIPGRLSISSFDTFAWSPYLSPNWDICLAARLIYEKFVSKRGDWFAEYVHSLPTVVESPLNWTVAEKNELFEHVRRRAKSEWEQNFEEMFVNMTRDLSKVPDLVHTCPHCLYKETYTWAMLIVFSRTFLQKLSDWKKIHNKPLEDSDEEVEGGAMYPFLDLTNHQPLSRSFSLKNITRKFEVIPGNSSTVALYALRNFTAGHEIVWEYGEKANFDLLYYYGFVMEYNKHENFTFELKSDQPCLGTLRKSSNCGFMLRCCKVEKNLLKMLRQEVTGTQEVENVSNPVTHFQSLSEHSTPESRRQLLEALRRYRSRLKYYHGLLAENWPLRAERRALKDITEVRRRLVFQFGIAKRVLLLSHLRLIDTSMMKALWTSLELPD